MKDLHCKISNEIFKKLTDTAKRFNISKTQLLVRYISSYEGFSELQDRLFIAEEKIRKLEARKC